MKYWRWYHLSKVNKRYHHIRGKAACNRWVCKQHPNMSLCCSVLLITCAFFHLLHTIRAQGNQPSFPVKEAIVSDHGLLVTIFNGEDYSGLSRTIDIATSECTDIPDSFGAVQSIDTNGFCVLMFAEPGCPSDDTASSVRYATPSTENNRLNR